MRASCPARGLPTDRRGLPWCRNRPANTATQGPSPLASPRALSSLYSDCSTATTPLTASRQPPVTDILRGDSSGERASVHRASYSLSALARCSLWKAHRPPMSPPPPPLPRNARTTRALGSTILAARRRHLQVRAASLEEPVPRGRSPKPGGPPTSAPPSATPPGMPAAPSAALTGASAAAAGGVTVRWPFSWAGAQPREDGSAALPPR
jgi:hypothetical protein